MALTHAGLQLNSTGRLNDGDTFYVEPRQRPAAGFRLIQTDPEAIAAAERLRVTASEANISESKVSLSYGQETAFQGFEQGTDILSLGNNSSTAAGIEVTASNLAPAFVIPSGADNVSLMMEVPQDSGLRMAGYDQRGRPYYGPQHGHSDPRCSDVRGQWI